MPDLICRDGDLNGYGCISSQFVDSLTYVLPGPPAIGGSQWFGKITRFRYELELLSGARVSDDAIQAAIVRMLITSCTLKNVQYTVDPLDPTVAYAEGELELVAAAGSPIPSSVAGTPHRFRHTLKRVWRLTETKFL